MLACMGKLGCWRPGVEENLINLCLANANVWRNFVLSWHCTSTVMHICRFQMNRGHSVLLPCHKMFMHSRAYERLIACQLFLHISCSIRSRLTSLGEEVRSRDIGNHSICKVAILLHLLFVGNSLLHESGLMPSSQVKWGVTVRVATLSTVFLVV